MNSAPDMNLNGTRPETESSFAGAGLFVFVFALVQAGLVVWFRGVQAGLYVPPRLLALSVSLAAAVCFAPFLPPDRWRGRTGLRLYLYPLVSFAVMASAVAGQGLGGIASVLVYLYAALGLVGLGRALPRLRLLPARSLGLLPVAAIFAVYVFYYFNQWNYAGVFMPEYALVGRLRKDGYFATVIAHMIQNYGVSSTGLDGVLRLRYHVGSHTWFAGLGKIAGTMPLLTYPFIHQIVLIPAQMLALLFSIICAAGTRRRLTVCVAAALAMVYVTDAIGRPSHYVSESYAAGVTGLLFFWPLLLDLLAAPERGRWEDPARLALALLAVFVISSLKISAGMVWTAGLCWMLLRQYRFRPRGLLTIALAAVLLSVALKIYSDPGQAAVFAPLKFFRHHPRLLFLTCWIVPGLYVAAVMVKQKIATLNALRQAARERRTLGAEVIVLMALVGAAPATLLWLSNAWAWFFFNLTQWPAMSMLIAEWDFQMFRTPGRRRAARTAVAVATALCLYAGARFFYYNFSIGYLHGTTEFAAGAAGSGGRFAATPDRPYGSALDARLASAPGYRAYRLIMEAARGRGLGFAVHVPASNTTFWRIVKNCEAESLFVPAVTGRPMLYGVLPPEIQCDLAFYGYPDYGQDAFARDLDPAALCAHARSRGFDTVFELNDLDQPDRNRVLDCGDRRKE